jgi:hypothetical protein
MKKIQLVLAGVVVALLSQSATAIVFKTEQFVNFADGRLGDAGTGGTGSDGGWFTPHDQITVTNSKGSLLGNSLGLVASLGARASIAATNEFGTNAFNGSYTRFVASQTFRPDQPTNIYTSFLYRFDNLAEVSTAGQPISAMNRQNSGLTTLGSFSWYLFAKRVGDNIQLGLTRAGTPNQYASTTNYATTNLTAGETFFVVVRQQIIPPASAPDVIDLWINPPPGLFGEEEANIPPPSVSTSDGVDDTSNTGPGRFWIFASGASASMDEIRIANNWAEATPPLGQCLTAGITTNPTNVTQVAEINAAFHVVPSGTGATIQWQLSTNNGSTWNNIAGATAATYTTPNLSLADNGNQYRAVVSVACDASSATSAVASVTLTAPTVSPTGLVLHDKFFDTDDIGFNSRNNTPVAISNSVWFTTTEPEGNPRLRIEPLIGSDPVMIGTPISGTSSLWLGYFTKPEDAPIHLGIGRTLRVTMPFTPNAFTAQTNNGALRFGLFNYADGGNRIITDGNNVTGSTGNGAGVRGYMLSVDFGPTFTANSPLSLLARIGMGDNNLMGTTGAYQSMGSGPAGGGYTNVTAFQAGITYNLVLSVTRTDVNSVNLSVSISGGGTNWTHSATDNEFANYRFDSFAIRPNSLETSADSFTFTDFIVEVLQSAIPVPQFSITAVESLSPTSVKLTWDSVAGATYHVLARDSLSSGTWTTNATVVANGTATSYTNSPTTGSQKYYRILGLPYTP